MEKYISFSDALHIVESPDFDFSEKLKMINFYFSLFSTKKVDPSVMNGSITNLLQYLHVLNFICEFLLSQPAFNYSQVCQFNSL